MYSVILCGGSGTRLWPLSRKNFPKQFLKLYSEYSLLQETFLRMREIMPAQNIYFVTNEGNLFNVFNQVKELEKNFSKDQILVEPASLNTAPAIAYAVKYIAENTEAGLDSPILVVPSDHYIKDKEAYLKLVTMAMAAVGNHIGTIGITPDKPETGFGYIKKGQYDPAGFYEVLEFKEKPDLETALKYVESGQYVWNSGMYLFNARTFASELKIHAPEIHSLLAQELKIFLEKFKTLPSISIDFAVSEKSKNVVVFEGEFGWSDVGSFDSLTEIAQDSGSGHSRHVGIDSKNVFVHSTSKRLVTTVGVEDLIVIENNDSILIQKRGHSEDVRKVVNHLKEENYKELDDHLIVYRPWGKYEVLIDHLMHKVKKITVYPEAKLSLQAHFHRAEHWIVVKGVAKIVHGDEEIFLRENESTFIPGLTKHRLENPGKTDLELIEVQTGNYLEEDDIIRYEDVYNRLEVKK